MLLRLELQGPIWEPEYWNKREKDFRRDLHRLLIEYAADLRIAARQAAPREKGKLQSSIKSMVQWTEIRFGIKLYSDLNYAWYQEYGTGLYGEAPGHIKKKIVADKGKAFKIPAAGAGLTELRKPFVSETLYRKAGKKVYPGAAYKVPRKFGRFSKPSGNAKMFERESSKRWKGYVFRNTILGIDPEKNSKSRFMRRTLEEEEKKGELMARIERLAALYGFY